MTADEARRIALSLDGAVEQDHHGRPSFRVGKRLAAVRVHLPAADEALVEPLVAEAWQRRT